MMEKGIEQIYLGTLFAITYFSLLRLRGNTKWTGLILYVFFNLSNFIYLYIYEWIITNPVRFQIAKGFAILAIIGLLVVVTAENIWKILLGFIITDVGSGLFPIIIKTWIFPDSLLLSLNVGTILFGILYLCIKKFLDKFKQSPMENTNIALKGIVLIWIIFLFFPIIPNYSMVSNQFLLINILICAFVVTGTCIILQKNSRNKQLNSYLLLKQGIMEEYYRILGEQSRLTETFARDIEKHMAYLSEFVFIEDNKQVAMDWDNQQNSLRKEYQLLSGKTYCNIKIINAMLNNKMEVCREKKINFEIDIQWEQIHYFAVEDLLGLLFNLVDNAIEGCLQIDDCQRRNISLVGMQSDHNLILVIRNTKNPAIILSAGKKTIKKDELKHGMGIEIIREIVGRYKGSMNIQERKDSFEVEMSFTIC